jgi:hypothetical protein
MLLILLLETIGLAVVVAGLAALRPGSGAGILPVHCAGSGETSVAPVPPSGRDSAGRPRARARSVLAVGGAALAVALLLWSIHRPLPGVHDEFSYLLAADTFAHGRLANPAHPMWEHFETFHVLQQPTYASKYPPAQGLLLALGQVLTGHPIAGVWLGAALAAAAVCWMLQGWVPDRWAFWGGLIAALHFNIQRAWGQSFWGGSVAMAGGALVYGALPRIVRDARPRHAVVMGLGLSLLAASRPYEGLLASLPAAAALIAWPLRRPRPALRVVAGRVLFPLVAVLSLAAAGLACYNARVTGSALTMPYQLYERQYSVTPLFLWESPRPEPEYRHAALRDFFVGWALPHFERQRTLAGAWQVKTTDAFHAWYFFLHVTLTLPLLALPWVLRDRRLWPPAAAVVLVCLGSLWSPWFKPHYLAPAVPVLFVLNVQGLRRLRTWRWHNRPAGRTLVAAIVLAYLLIGVVQTALYVVVKPQEMSRQRSAMAARLEAEPGRHLVVVRYGPRHSPHAEWVYNAAEIDSAKVVWAREMGPQKDRELLDYFKDRRAWLLLADATPPRLVPYPERVKIPGPSAPDSPSPRP